MDWVRTESQSLQSGLSLNSWHFLLIAILAVALFRAPLGRICRQSLLLVFNLYFFAQFVQSWVVVGALLLLLLTTYLCAELRGRFPDSFPTSLYIILILLFWILLFLIKDPKLGGLFNPFYHFPIYIIGISYIVFRCIQYFMDVELHENRSLLTFVNFVLFFPTLLAGPIDRYDRFQRFAQVGDLPADESVLPYLHRIANGFIKKFLLADHLALFSIVSKSDMEVWPVSLLWLGVLIQPVVLYLDFSGYCDIMIGLARLMGFRVCENFNAPWKARNIQEFWNRWHISLSHFLRDYVHTPLSSFVARFISIRWQFLCMLGVYMLTMMLIALWHGTTWGFFVFGLLHGAALILLQLTRRYVHPRLPKELLSSIQHAWPSVLLSRACTFCFLSLTMLTWSQGVTQSVHILKAMFGA